MANTNSESADRSKLNNGRRSFIRKTGAALSAVVASAAAGFSKPAADTAAGLKDQIAQLSSRVGNLEDAEAVRRLHQVYESRLDRGMYEDAVALFADDAEVEYNGGLFNGKESIRRLFCGHFAPGLTGKKIEPPPGFEPDPAQHQDIVRVAEDRKTATGQFSYSIQVGTPMTGDSSLLEMARLQGEGVAKWWEGGTCEASYARVGESWKIRRLEYRTASKADYRPGRAYAKPIEVQAFRSVFPGNPNGPDRLV
jgi:carotenoid cleavage dioxygenase